MHSARVSWHQYFIRITHLVAERSTCLRRRVGAIAVKEKRILATGYNGPPAGVAHCSEIGCLRQKYAIPSGKSHELCRGLHAEQNVIVQSAVHGIPLAGASLYCTTQPCLICMKMLINCGIKKIWHSEAYPDALSEEMAKEAGVELILLPLDSIPFPGDGCDCPPV